MSITTEMNGIYATNRQSNDVFVARAQLQQARNTIIEANSKIQTIVDAGSFSTIPATTLAALSNAWTALKVAQSSMNTANINEVLNWTQ
jgi:hypothetical protein